MRPQTRTDEAGWVLFEAVLLGLIALGVAAVIGIFARTALLEEYASARMEAALTARAQFSMMEAELDQGIVPQSGVTAIVSNGRTYTVDRSVVRQGEFCDVSLRLSWEILGHEEQADFVRRLRHHGAAAKSP